MNEFEKNEIIKAFAYGFTAEQVAEECEMTVKEAERFCADHADEIEKKKKASEIYE